MNIIQGLRTNPESNEKFSPSVHIIALVVLLFTIVSITFFISRESSPFNAPEVSVDSAIGDISSSSAIVFDNKKDEVRIITNSGEVAHASTFSEVDEFDTQEKVGVSTPSGDLIINSGVIDGAATVTYIMWRDMDTFSTSDGSYDKSLAFGFLRKDEETQELYLEDNNGQDIAVIRDVNSGNFDGVYSPSGKKLWSIEKDEFGYSAKKEPESPIDGLELTILISYALEVGI